MDQKGLWVEKPKGTNRQKSQKATKIRRSKDQKDEGCSKMDKLTYGHCLKILCSFKS